MPKGDKYFKGKGKVWLDNVNYADCYKVDIKQNNEYEEVDDPKGDGKVRIWVGKTFEGSLTIRKTGKMDILKKLQEENGYEFNVVVKEMNEQTGYFETKKYIDCTVDDFPTSQLESKKITEVELSIKARAMEKLA